MRSPASTSKQVAPIKDQVEVIKTAVQDALGGLLTEILKNQNAQAVQGKLFPNGIELIDLAVQVGLPNTPIVEFKLKIAGPNPKQAASIPMLGLHPAGSGP